MDSEKDLRNCVYKFAVSIIKFMDILPYSISTQVIVKQVIRSATSIGANIIEAKSSSSKKEFINFYTYSLKSANETKFWLALLRDTKKANEKAIESFLRETNDLANIIASSIITMKHNFDFEKKSKPYEK